MAQACVATYPETLNDDFSAVAEPSVSYEALSHYDNKPLGYGTFDEPPVPYEMITYHGDDSAIDRALARWDAGERFYTHEEVFARLDAIIEKYRKKATLNAKDCK